MSPLQSQRSRCVGAAVKVPSGKGKYVVVVVAPENPTKQQKNQGLIAWMVKN